MPIAACKSRDDVEKRDPGLHRPPSGSPVTLMSPDSAWTMMSYPGTTGRVRHVLVECRQRAGDQCWCFPTEVFQGKPHSAMRPGRKFSINTSEPVGEATDRVDALWGLEVDRDRALVPVERQEVGGVVSHEGRSPVAGIVTVTGTLDLDHVGAQIAQDLGRERSREHPREVQDAEGRTEGGGPRAETTRLF